MEAIMNSEENYAIRKKRLADALSLKEPDMVPLAPKVGMYYGTAYGISYYDIMMDIRNAIPGLKLFLDQFEPDLVWLPVVYPIPPMEALGANYIKWPGPSHNLPLTSPYQVLDGTYVYDDELLEFAQDPTHFFLTKIFPRKHNNLKGFSKLYLRNPIEFSQFADFAAFADPEVKAALDAVIKCGEEAIKWQKGLGEIAKIVLDKGFVVGPSGAQTCPYDMFSDNYRGLMKTAMDMVERPEELEIVMDTLSRIAVERTITLAKAANLDYIFIPLHGGSDEFMSPQNYERFYWKGLKVLMDAIIDNGMIPYVFCEGNYDSRLNKLAEVPKGKVIYMFEKVDMKQAKKILGSTACICGNLSSSLMVFGKPEQVADECKRLLDICAPGGGFMMDVSIDLTQANPRNVEVMFETTRTYGKY
jgi:hypothetical protein